MSYGGFTPVSPDVSTGSTPSPPPSAPISESSSPPPSASPPSSAPISESSSPSPSAPNSKALITINITTMAAVGVVMLIVITIMTYKYRQNKRQKNQETSSGVGKKLLMTSATSGGDTKIELTSTERFIEEFSKEKPMRFSPDDLIAFTSNYSHQLGSGGFGVVYKGEMYNGVLVAVKVLKKISDSIISEQFAAELYSIGRTYHINLVKLYGFCFDNEMKALVYEYMENGSLESCLAAKGKLDWEKLYQIAIGTARGIRYLHEECHKMIIHYDIKPGNVLLSQNFSPKVADFGMAELWDRESTLQTVTQGRGTPGFIAPELSQPLSATHKCDVYSYGMLLFQIVGSRRIMEGKQADSLLKSANWVREKAGKGEFVSIMSSCGIEEKDRLKAKRICEAALTCVLLQPEKRPSMSTILMMLEGEKDICVQVSLLSNMSSGELAGSKPEPYSRVASGNLVGSKSKATDESGGSKSEQYSNVTFGELGGSKLEVSGGMVGSKSEPATGELGGSNFKLVNELGGPKSQPAFNELGGSKSEFFDELGGSKPDLGGSKPEASDELISGDLDGSKSEASGEFSSVILGGSKSKPSEPNSNSQADVDVGSLPAKQVASN